MSIDQNSDANLHVDKWLLDDNYGCRFLENINWIMRIPYVALFGYARIISQDYKRTREGFLCRRSISNIHNWWSEPTLKMKFKYKITKKCSPLRSKKINAQVHIADYYFIIRNQSDIPNYSRSYHQVIKNVLAGRQIKHSITSVLLPTSIWSSPISWCMSWILCSVNCFQEVNKSNSRVLWDQLRILR